MNYFLNWFCLSYIFIRFLNWFDFSYIFVGNNFLNWFFDWTVFLNSFIGHIILNVNISTPIYYLFMFIFSCCILFQCFVITIWLIFLFIGVYFILFLIFYIHYLIIFCLKWLKCLFLWWFCTPHIFLFFKFKYINLKFK